MATEEKVTPGAPAQYTPPQTEAPTPPAARDPAALISELLRPRAAPRLSREEQAFIDLQRCCNQ
jgi:hypothetical protein